ncbi:MAG: tetratricopeptide repeat protein, partial [Cyanobacteria bacterium P01_F01_bin.53]
MLLAKLDTQNQRMFRKLVVSIKANVQQLDLLLVICDDRNLQALLIDSYEAELQTAGMNAFRARLNPKQPSMRASLEALVASEP